MIRSIPKEVWLAIAIALVLGVLVATPFYLAGCGRSERVPSTAGGWGGSTTAPRTSQEAHSEGVADAGSSMKRLGRIMRSGSRRPSCGPFAKTSRSFSVHSIYCLLSVIVYQ